MRWLFKISDKVCLPIAILGVVIYYATAFEVSLYMCMGWLLLHSVLFQSTHPVRGGTAKVYKKFCITCALSTKMVRNREKSAFLHWVFSTDFSQKCHFSGANRPGKWR